MINSISQESLLDDISFRSTNEINSLSELSNTNSIYNKIIDREYVYNIKCIIILSLGIISLGIICIFSFFIIFFYL